MKVKICGITTYEDAALALDCGADALGFNFYAGSRRYLAPASARRITDRLPVFCTSVGVFVNEPDPDAVAAAAREAGVTTLQLHGDESAEYCRRLSGWPLIKAVRIGDGPLQYALEDFRVRAFLLDTRDDAAFGGTGRIFDWTLAVEVKRHGLVILAGGLTPANVRDAICAVQPYGVDVCSGVESSPGRKDRAKLMQFINEARKCE